MAGALPLVGEGGGGGGGPGGGGDGGAGGGGGGARQELAPACSGAVALKRVTSLLATARRADAQGKYQQARELYAEVLKVQKSLARAPLGSIGKSLRDVAVGVEARLRELRQELREGDSTTCGSSRPATTNSVPSSSSLASASAAAAPGASASVGAGTAASAIGIAAIGGGGAVASSTSTAPGSGRQRSLDGVRPSTRDGQRLQQMIEGSGGSRRGHSRGTRGGSSGHSPGAASAAAGAPATPRDPGRPPLSARGAGYGSSDDWASAMPPPPSSRESNGQRPQTRDSARPPTRDSARPPTRDSARPPTRSGLGAGAARGQDVSIRQVTGRRSKRHSQQAAEVFSPERHGASAASAAGGCSSYESLSPCPDADESVELLE